MKTRFPSFLSLSGEDKTDANKYRANLYGSINMPLSERAYRLMDFMSFVLEKEHGNKKEMKNIEEYGGFTHLNVNDNLEQKHRNILNFYTR